MSIFVTLADVKINNSYTYYKVVAPTTSELEPAYTTGQTWLDTVTGFSYQLTNQITGTWVQIETDIDEKINTVKNATCQTVITSLSNKFIVGRNSNYFDEDLDYNTDYPARFSRENAFTLVETESVYGNFTIDGSAKTITLTADTDIFGSLTDAFAIGDIIYIGGSKRNDEYYTVDTVTDTEIKVLEDTLKSGVSNFFIFLTDVPDGLISIIGRMIWYDVYKRPLLVGMKSEKIGSYSYIKAEANNNYMRYPDDVISGLDAYDGIATGGESYFVN